MKVVSTYEEQEKLWLKGENAHVDVRGDGEHECTPDFACCKPSLAWDAKTRKLFASLPKDSGERYQMLMMSLGAALSLAAPDKKVHIAGDVPDIEH